MRYYSFINRALPAHGGVRPSHRVFNAIYILRSTLNMYDFSPDDIRKSLDHFLYQVAFDLSTLMAH